MSRRRAVTAIAVAAVLVGACSASPARPAPGAGTPFCTINAEVNAANSGVRLTTATPAELEHFYRVTLPADLVRLADAAPPELRADVALLTEGLERFATEFERLKWDAVAITADTVVGQLGSDPKYNAADQHISAFCGSSS